MVDEIPLNRAESHVNTKKNYNTISNELGIVHNKVLNKLGDGFYQFLVMIPYYFFVAVSGGNAVLTQFAFSETEVLCLNTTNGACDSNSPQCEHLVYGKSELMEHTAVEFLDLGCNALSYIKFEKSVYIFGLLLGSFIGGRAVDLLGRRKASIISSTTELILVTSMILIPNVWHFYICRIYVGIASMVSYMAGTSMACEISKPRSRIFWSMTKAVAFPLGISYQAILSYYIFDWRVLGVSMQYSLTLPCLIFLIFFGHESPQWCLNKRRISAYKRCIKFACKFNRTDLEHIQGHFEEIDSLTSADVDSEKNDEWNFVTWITGIIRNFLKIGRLFSNFTLAFRTIIYSYIFITVVSVYYTYLMGIKDLFDLPLRDYLSLTAVFDVPALVIVGILLELIGRKYVIVCCFLAAAGFLLMSIAFPGSAIYSSSLSRAFVNVSFSSIFPWINESYPTLYRSSALGFCSTFGRFAGLSIPYLKSITLFGDMSISIMFFGALMLSAVSCIFLPETKGKRMPATINEATTLFKIEKSNSSKA